VGRCHGSPVTFEASAISAASGNTIASCSISSGRGAYSNVPGETIGLSGCKSVSQISLRPFWQHAPSPKRHGPALPRDARCDTRVWRSTFSRCWLVAFSDVLWMSSWAPGQSTVISWTWWTEVSTRSCDRYPSEISTHPKNGYCSTRWSFDGFAGEQKAAPEPVEI